jgi:hypothetical protein
MFCDLYLSVDLVVGLDPYYDAYWGSVSSFISYLTPSRGSNHALSKDQSTVSDSQISYRPTKTSNDGNMQVGNFIMLYTWLILRGAAA